MDRDARPRPGRDPTGAGWLLAVVVVLSCGAAARVEGRPCWSCDPLSFAPIGWWRDRALQPGATNDHAPRIDVDGNFAAGRVAIAWERRDGGDGDIVLATSDDGGCSWTTNAVTSGAADDRAPDVAVSFASDVVAVTFVRGGAVVATVSRDGGRTFPPPELVSPAAPADAAARPRLGMVATGAGLHLHVAWVERGRLRLARSLAAGAPGSWVSDAPLSDRLVGFSDWSSVDLAADTRSTDATTDSAVTLVASGLAPGASFPEVYALRSNDSGVTFFGDPATPATLDVPRRVSDAADASGMDLGSTGPIVDVSDDGSGIVSAWEAVVYGRDRVSGPDARADGREEEGAGPTTLSDWCEDPSGDAVVSSGGGRAAALAVIPNPLDRPAFPETHAFAESATGELVVLRGELDGANPQRFTPTCGDHVLTGSDPPRRAGGVVPGSASADEDLSHVFLAWADTRDGGSAIWWKRTDTLTSRATAVTAVPGDCATGGGLLVSWVPPASPPNCDVDHVRVQWGSVSGRYSASQDVFGASSVQVRGLPEGVQYFALVTVVDEACNEAAAPEVSGTTATCGPVACPNPVGWTLRAARRPTRADVELTWAPPPVDAGHGPAASYDVYRATVRARDGFSLVGNVPASPFDDVGAVGPTTAPLHFYRVIARNACGTSGDEPLP